MQRSVSRFYALDRNDRFVLDVVGQHRAGIICDAVDQYRTCAAFSAITADFGAGQIEFVPQGIGKCLRWHDIDRACAAVDVEIYQALGRSRPVLCVSEIPPAPVVAAAPEKMTPLIKRLRVSLEFTDIAPFVVNERIRGERLWYAVFPRFILRLGHLRG